MRPFFVWMAALVSLIVFTSVVWAQKKTVKDPYCEMQIEKSWAADSTVYNDVTYYFCSDYCKQLFVANPENYVWDYGDIPVVSLTKAPIKVKQAPGEVSVITAAQIRNSGAHALSEVLRFVPGVNVRLTPMGWQIEMRSFGDSPFANRVALLVDGVPYNRADTGGLTNHPAWHGFFLPLSVVKRVEVIKGPVASLYGSNAFWGAINIVTKSGQDLDGGNMMVMFGEQESGLRRRSTYGFTLGQGLFAPMIGVGEFQLHDMVMFTYGRDFGDLDWILDGMYMKDGGNMNHIEKIKMPHLNLSTKVTAKDLTLAAYYRYNEATPFKFNNIDTKKVKEWIGVGDIGYHRQVTKAIDIAARVSYSRREGNTCANCHNPEGRGNFPLSYSPFDPEEELEKNEKIFGRLETTAKLNQNHLVTAGTEYQVDRTDRRVVLLPKADKSIFTRAGYLQDQIDFWDGRLTFILGTRYDDHEVVGGNFSSRILAAYSPNERLTVRAGWSTGVRAPTWTELNLDQYLVPGRDPADTIAQIAAVLYRGNRDLREETIRSFDVGGEYRFSDNFGAKASLFYSRLDRFIGLRQKPEVGSNYDIHTWENSPRGKLYGGELELHLRGGDLLKSLIHYTYQKVDVGREPSLNPSYAPRHKIFTQLTLTPTKMLKIYGIVSHWRDFKSSYFRLGMPLEPFSVAKLDLDPYTILETTVTYMIPLGAGNRMIMLSLVGENLLDDERAYYSRAAANIVDSHNLGRQYMFMIMYMF